jgi:hypothetical protein
MQSFSRDLVAGLGRHHRMTALADSDFLGGVGEGQVPGLTGRSLRKSPRTPLGRRRIYANTISMPYTCRSNWHAMQPTTGTGTSGQERVPVNASLRDTRSRCRPRPSIRACNIRPGTTLSLAALNPSHHRCARVVKRLAMHHRKLQSGRSLMNCEWSPP